ncbi:sigma-54-dependent Fis family transcriptional regulator [Halodesulfovibrio marinisediminis]|uniref:Transcriptional regulator containing PAS, AAA-type ATPase, and DNA-binding Fis domains n=1 Tax=Halodesulfovibrio marinisediminis DSM 17456 TaxID=1121457 RepID=A0A1N6GRV5_9BACT|nr:sigma 54-interacting transcriptional regulator [Halodesulfovibrio marinisediminis]SIO10258.1 Transcriptional regulator containing PAS, AAA-type ATPase, and DNA-binding Fis domains [Halodesulfovibrio marinisediminis DSM 17456]
MTHTQLSASKENAFFVSTELNARRYAQIIQDSHARSKAMGIDPNQTASPEKYKLSPEQLRQRIKDSQPFYDLVTTQMSTLYQILKGSGFCMAVADADGYVLHALGDAQILEHYKKGNCMPGYLWTEEAVGTCGIGLALIENLPIQISGKEMFCKRAHHITNSATPVHDNNGKLLGVIALSGQASTVHIHTLGMVILTAKAIRSQIGEIEKAREIAIRNTYMTALMESDQRGIIALNGNGEIMQINQKANALLGIDQRTISNASLTNPDEAEPSLNISTLTRTRMDWKHVLHSKQGFSEREVTFIRGDSRFPLVCTLDPITMPDGESAGGILLVMEHDRMLQLANEMAGSQARFTFDSILGSSTALEEAKKVANAAARGNAAVLLHGETGTGKELFAQAIHNASPRHNKPFVVINCGAIPNELLESELFGYVEGAFTGALKGGRPGKFELADGGTLFLDEIGDMPLDMQVKILRALQSGEVNRVGDMQPIKVDLRIIAATNVDLDTAIKRGTFREDLFYRISTLNITIPPLRDRGNDVLTLAETFLHRIRPRLGKPELEYSQPALQALSQASWPGNIRQLENAVERAVNICEKIVIMPDDLGLDCVDSKASLNIVSDNVYAQNMKLPNEVAELRSNSETMLGEMEHALIMRLMEEHMGNISKIARSMGVSRPTLYRKLKKYRITHD